MNWISIKDNLPDIGDIVLVYKSEHVGGYVPGIYIAYYNRIWKEFRFFIEDRTTNGNNIRPLEEFSHWMPLPPLPDTNL